MIHSRVRPEVVDRYLQQCGQPLRGSAPERARRLEVYFEVQSAANRIELSHCDRCDAVSDAALPTCAFCGDADPIEPPAGTEGDATGIVVREVEPTEPTTLAGVLAELRECARHHWRNVYRVGQLLRRIRDEELWRDAKTAGGWQQYKGYRDFVGAEVGIGPAYATRLIRVVERFTAAEVEEWGISRLAVAARLPEEQRRAFLKRTKAVPTRQLAHAATEPDDEERGPFPRLRGTEEVIAKVPIGRVVARLYAGAKRGDRVGEPTEAAVSFDQRPWTQVQLPGGLWMRLDLRRAHDATGQLLVAVQFRREPEVTP